MQVTAVKALETRLSRMMPDDIAIHAVSVAPDGFDARFSALERTYVYRIADARVPWDPRLRDFVWRTDRELDIAQMNAAAALTLGLHDFRFVRHRESRRHDDPRGEDRLLAARTHPVSDRTRHGGSATMRLPWNLDCCASRLSPTPSLATWCVRS